ncbi:hypothetical protein THASP1DRAFT_32020 [Thamnocephalis sphaerospora]|uniref:Uncharacterized protein n=1 Tax=Thamnocephalis sphaerospora TaxID=78915 RepID=A0A4P9XK68_9FUNG|nr:hypothetical protein THASP1DRAFT_32020 [Thamnocephalis sphaerospora]|eukprot:RKP06155.1 hypothetical protein THASP1DRAFT_32020 [Thamnocephalis sphaerospora]
MSFLDPLWSIFSGKDEPEAHSWACTDVVCQLAELTAKVKHEMADACSHAIGEIGRLADDTMEAQRYAQREWHREKHQAAIERDWAAGYFQGKLDQAAGRAHHTLDDTYTSAPDIHNKADWAAGYYHGRLDEARSTLKDKLDQAREKNWRSIERLWHTASEGTQERVLLSKAREEAHHQAEEIAAKMSDAKSHAKEMLDDKYEETMTKINDLAKIAVRPAPTLPSFGNWWRHGLLEGVKSALVDRVSENRRHAAEEAAQVQEAMRQIGKKAGQASGWVQEHAEQLEEEARARARDNAAYIKEAAEEKADAAWSDAHAKATQANEWIREHAAQLEKARAQAHENAAHIKEKIEDSAETAWSGALDKASQMAGVIRSGITRLEERIVRDAEGTADRLRADARYAMDTMSGTVEQARERLLRSNQHHEQPAQQISQAGKGVSPQAYYMTKDQAGIHAHAHSLLDQARSIAATYLAQRMAVLVHETEHAAEMTRRRVATLDKELSGSMRDTVQRISRGAYPGGVVNRHAENKAVAEDHDHIIAYVRATLFHMERDAHDSYSTAQKLRDDAAEVIRQHFTLLAEYTRQLGDADSKAVEERFEQLTRRVADAIEQYEEQARERYDTARRMCEQAELGLRVDLGEFLDSLHGWLDRATRTAEQHHEQAQTIGRILGDELIGNFGAIHSPIVRSIRIRLARVFDVLGPQDVRGDTHKHRLWASHVHDRELHAGQQGLPEYAPSPAAEQRGRESEKDARIAASHTLQHWWNWLLHKGNKAATAVDTKLQDDAQRAHDQIMRTYEEARAAYERARDAVIPAVREPVQEGLAETKDLLHESKEVLEKHVHANASNGTIQGTGARAWRNA